MVRYLTDREKAAVFFCDRCGEVLDENDSSEVYIEDVEKFIDDVHAGRDDSSQCEFLCRCCFEVVQADEDGVKNDEQI